MQEIGKDIEESRSIKKRRITTQEHDDGSLCMGMLSSILRGWRVVVVGGGLDDITGC